MSLIALWVLLIAFQKHTTKNTHILTTWHVFEQVSFQHTHITIREMMAEIMVQLPPQRFRPNCLNMNTIELLSQHTQLFPSNPVEAIFHPDVTWHTSESCDFDSSMTMWSLLTLSNLGFVWKLQSHSLRPTC